MGVSTCTTEGRLHLVYLVPPFCLFFPVSNTVYSPQRGGRLWKVDIDRRTTPQNARVQHMSIHLLPLQCLLVYAEAPSLQILRQGALLPVLCCGDRWTALM